MSLEIKKSKIPGAGKGLFTTKLIKRGERVIEYTGEVITWKECQERNEKKDGFGAYYFYISEKKCIDAEHVLDSLARYANDAAGFVRIPGVRNNCRYEVIKNRAYIIASRNLKPGDEIFVAYGKEYWDALRQNGIGPDAKKKKAVKKKKEQKLVDETHVVAKRIETHHA
ncbi:MAG: SET domain-containing protein [Bacteroidia bacterium]